MEIHDALAFAVILRLGSISRAAEHLHVAQSALSRRLKRLEEDLGQPLLDRHARGIRPSPAGLRLIALVTPIEDQIKLINEEFSDPEQNREPGFSIAMPHGAVKLFGAALIERLKLSEPGPLHVIERESSFNRQAVLDGDVDIALSYSLEASAELAVYPLFRERLLLVGPAKRDGVDIKYPRTVAVRKLATLPLIVPGKNHGYRLLLDRITERADISPNIALEVDGLPAMTEFVERGLGYTVATYAQMQVPIADGRVVAVPFASSHCSVTLNLLIRSDRANSVALVRLRRAIESAATTASGAKFCQKISKETERDFRAS